MKTILEVRNVHACGCPNALHKALAGMQGIFGVRIDTLRGMVAVEHTDEVTPQDMVRRLREAGYHAGVYDPEDLCPILQPGTKHVP